MVRSSTLTPSGRSPKVSLNRSAVVEIKRQGSKTKTQVLHVNFDKKDLPTLISCVETALHKSPSDPPVRLASLSYLPAEEIRAGSSTSAGASALDGTPFCPRSKQTKTARHGRRNKYTLFTPENFEPKLFWAMDKVYIEAVVRTEGEEEEQEVVNDENNRRLSNGSVATSTTPPAGRGVDTNTNPRISGSGSGRPPRSVSPPSRSLSPAEAVSPSSPPCVNRSSRAAGFERADPSVSPSSPARKGPSKEPSGGRGDDGDGLFKELLPPSVVGEASSPAISALSSRASSIATHEHGGVGGNGGRGRELSSENHDSGFDGDVDSSNPAHTSRQSGASSITTVTAPGDVGLPELASPGPGKLSVLFRRASAASQLPPDPDTTRDGDREDGATSGAEEQVDGSGGGGGDGGGEGGSIDSSSVGTGAGLTGGDGRRAPSRRDPVAKQQRPQAQPRGRGSDRDREFTRWGGRREVWSGSASSAGTACSGSSRGMTAGKVGGQRRKVDKSGVDSGERDDLGDKQQQRKVAKKKELYPASGTTGAIAKSREPKKRNPATPSSKKAFTAGGATTATSTSTTATPRKQHQQRSAWAAKPSERRQPPSKPAGTPKAKLPLRTNSATKMNTKTKSPRPKGTASGEGMSGGSGGGSSRVGESDGATSGGGSPSPSKRPPPRVSTSSHMFWERNLRSVSKISSKTPFKKKDNSPSGKKDALRRAMRKAGNGGGWGGGGGGGGRGGEGEDGRPSVGTWTKAQNYLQILKELSGKDDEELQWLAVAKEGKGVEKSEKRQESAETEYHRLLCQESMQQAGLKLIKDRRLEVALKVFGKMGNNLERLTERLEELGEKEMALIAEDEEAEHQASVEVDAVVAKAATAELEAAEAEAGAAEVSVEGDEDAGAAAVRAAEAVTAARAAAEATVASAATSRASRQEQRERLEQERGEAEEKLGKLLEDITTGKEKLGALGVVLKEECWNVPGGGGSALETVVGITADVCSARELIAPARAKSGIRSLEGAAKALAEELKKTRSESQSALARMEKWRERKEALPEYEKEISAKEKAWFEREAAANEEALRRTRALLPVGVTGLTVAQLEQRAIEAGSLYPRELALRLKENRLLHWTVTHRDDIARSNFLRGDHAHYFTNLDQYDLVELRAVMACLPAKFEVDADGRKAAWRATFLQRVQGLVAQERGETVSGGWDPELQARRQVQLPKLTGEQMRRKEYHYPTATEVEQKVEKLQARQRRLEAKQAKLAQVKDELLPEAKEEYANVLEDTRHPANKEAFKPEDLRRARDEAKAEVDRLSKEVRRFEGDVASAQRALRESPSTVESLQAEAEATRRLLTERARKARISVKQQQEEVKERGAKEKAAAAAAVAGPAEEASPAAVVSGSTEKEEVDDGDRDTAAAGKNDEAMVAHEQEEEEEAEVEVEEEVEGGFDPTPELKSRFADKSRSLRFVTAEEDARLRKQELASVFSARNKAAAMEEDNEGEDDKPSTSLTIVREASEEGSGSSSEGEKDQRNSPADGAAAGDAGEERGIIKGRMKAFGAILEKTLSQSMLGRAPPSGTVAAGAAASAGVDAVAGGKMRVLVSPTRQQKQQSKKKAPAVLTPPCKPKSKFFRSIQSPPATSQVDGNGNGSAGGAGTGRLVVPPPLQPAPMMGLLSQIRSRGGGATGSGRSGSGDQTNVGMGGLLAQIRAAKGGNGGGNGVDGEKGVISVLEEGKDSSIAPPHLPQPPAPSFPPRSLFATAGPTAAAAAAAQGPPPDFFAQLRAKAAEKQALRCAAEAETDN